MNIFLFCLMIISVSIFSIFILANFLRLFIVFLRHSKIGANRELRTQLPKIIAWIHPMIMAHYFFHRHDNKPWAIGYVLYHIAIITLIMGYGISSLLLVYRLLQGEAIPTPEQFQNTILPFQYSLVIFGNGEPHYCTYLFGRYAELFQYISWVEICIAVTGNFCLLWGWMGSKVKTQQRSFTHLLVRVIIFSIIQCEILGRLVHWEYAAAVHAILGLILMSLVPFTYLRHIILFPFALHMVAKRRQFQIIA